jgi:hypothetical protein
MQFEEQATSHNNVSILTAIKANDSMKCLSCRCVTAHKLLEHVRSSIEFLIFIPFTCMFPSDPKFETKETANFRTTPGNYNVT